MGRGGSGALIGALVAPLLACPDGPMGGTSTTGDVDATTTDIATTSTTATGTTTAASTTGGGPPGCPPNADYSCPETYPCDQEPCGALRSRFDADGCMRRSCLGEKTCPQGYVCHEPALWGACVSAAYACSEDHVLGTCDCERGDDCDARYCVAEADLAPLREVPAGVARVEDACAPLARPAVDLVIGLDANNCKAAPGPTGTLRISVWDATAPLAPGHYPLRDRGAVWFDPEGDGDPQGSDAGYLIVHTWTGKGLSGEFEVQVGGHRFVGAVEAAFYCPFAPVCP